MEKRKLSLPLKIGFNIGAIIFLSLPRFANAAGQDFKVKLKPAPKSERSPAKASKAKANKNNSIANESAARRVKKTYARESSESFQAGSAVPYEAQLWLERGRVPLANGAVIAVDPNFGIARLYSEVSRGLFQNNLVVWVSGRGVGTWADVVEFDPVHGWMLLNFRTNVNIGVGQPVFQTVAGFWRTFGFSSAQDLYNTQEQLASMFNKVRTRVPAAKASPITVMEASILNVSGHIREDFISTSKKVLWSKDAGFSLPENMKCENTSPKIADPSVSSRLLAGGEIVCSREGIKKFQLKDTTPGYKIQTGWLSAPKYTFDRKYLSDTLSEVTKLFGSEIEAESAFVATKGNVECQTSWLQDKYIWTKTCVSQSRPFERVFDAVHTFGMLSGDRAVYFSIYLKSFSEEDHQNIIKKYLSELRGDPL